MTLMFRTTKRGTLIVLLTLAVCVRTHAQTAQTPRVWSPDPSLTGYLGPEVALDHCAFRLPTGLVLKKTESFASGRKNYTFEGPRHPQSMGASLIVTTETSQTHPPDWTLASAILDVIRRVVGTTTDYKITPIEQGVINNRPALRCYAKGDFDSDQGQALGGGRHLIEMHVFAYGIGDADLGTVLIAVDYAPYHTQSLPLLEAAAMTLRQTDPIPVPTAQSAAAAPADPSQWTPRADLLRFLSPESTTGGVTLRVPSGFDPIGINISGGDKASKDLAFGWQSRAGRDQVPATLRFIIQALPADNPNPKLPDLMNALVTAEGKDLTGYKSTDPEYGTTNYGPTGRFYALGTIKFAGTSLFKQMAIYGVLTKHYFVQIEAFDSDTTSAGTIHVMEASILSGSFASLKK